MRQLIPAIATIGLTAAAWSCSIDGCLENRSSIPLAGFYGSNGQGITLDSVRITGIGHDTVALSEEGQRISQVYLPMRATKESTSWQLAYMWEYLGAGALSDTITFDYEASPYFASDECGVIYRYNITRLTHTTNLIDSIIIVDSLITNIDVEQIKIYFRTGEDEEE